MVGTALTRLCLPYGTASFSTVIAREGGRSSIPEAVVIEPRSLGVLDAPVKPGHDSVICG